MYLSKLQLLGFKSFPEKTELVFDRGITSVVGPNGCGKTNLLDAIRWVLGESRMSVLRGSKLEEIIFAGTRDFKPLGMAEVSLLFDNQDHTIPSGYDQISVTRRLFRSGDSEFLINRTPCRLKDITEMFLDTGLGSSAYSVIEQSMVDVLLSDKTEDRRFLFEEAAGITKYKQRKRQALRKLEATDADLLRLQDVLAEVETQVRSLKRQVSKAERHRDLTDEIKRIGISLSSAEWNALEAKRSELAKQVEELRIKSEGNSARLKELELQREKVALEKTDLEKKARDIQEQLEKAVEECHILESEISVLKEKDRNAVESFKRSESEIENLERRRKSLESEITENRTRQDEFQDKVSQTNERLVEIEEELEKRFSELTALQQELESRQADLDSATADLAGRRESQLSLDLRYDADNAKLQEVVSEIESLESEEKKLAVEHEAGLNEARIVGDKLDSGREDSKRLEENLDSIDSKLAERQDGKRQTEAELERVAAKLEFLDKVIADYEGYSGGASVIGKLKGEIPGIHDTVANVIESDRSHSALVQAVLGDLAAYFIVDDDHAASAIHDRVVKEKLGRVGVIVRNRVMEKPVEDSQAAPPDCTPVRNLVRSDDVFAPVLDFLFDGHFIANSKSGELAAEYETVSFWEEDGRLIGSGGRIQASGSQEVVLVGRMAERDRFSETKSLLSDNLTSTANEIQRLAEDRKGIVESISVKRSELSNLQGELTQLSIKNSNREYELSNVRSRLAEKQRIRDALHTGISSISEDKSRLGDEVQALAERRTKLESEVGVIKLRTRDAEEAFSKTDKDASSIKMELISLEGQLDTLRTNGSRLAELLDDVAENVVTRETLQSEYLRTAAECKRLISETEETLHEKYKLEEEKRVESVSVSTQVAEVASGITEYDRELKTVRVEGSEILEQIHQIELDRSNNRSRIDALLADSSEKYDFDPATSSLHVKLTPEQRVEMSEELGDLKRKRDSLGPVNMLALDEYEEQSKRFEFLSAQVRDLNTAKDDLKSTITKINTTARKHFLDTLEEVQRNFSSIFEELFQGGEAEVKLEEGVDPLEANIVIKARPRGKKILSIQQLSGGERALTSISLLFALYLVKPSPFCILDEVDAPLDDANIGRFLKMIRRFSESTQFVIITHNKLTMEAADILYGVTMRHPGVSQIVSVNLKDGQDVEDVLEGKSTEEPADVESEAEPEFVETEK